MWNAQGDREVIRILVVMDEAKEVSQIREMTSEKKFYLQSDPTSWQFCSSLDDGIKAIGSTPFDIILLDLELPDSQGIQSFQTIQKVARDIPILILVDPTSVEDAVLCMENGAQDFLYKNRVDCIIPTVTHHATTKGASDQALVDAYRHISRMVENSQDAIVVLTSQNAVKYANRAAVSLFGRTVATFEELALPLDDKGAEEVSIMRPDGSTATVRIHIDDSIWYGEPTRFVTLRTIASGSHHKNEPNHLRHMVNVIQRLKKLIDSAKDPQKLIQQVCDLLIEESGYSSVWIVLRSQEGHPIKIGKAGWAAAIEPFTQEPLNGWVLPCERLVTTSDNDFALIDPKTDCEGCHCWKQHKFDRAIVNLLRHANRNFGILGVAFREHYIVQNDELLLLLKTAENLAFALHDISRESQRKESEDRYRQLFENINCGVAVYEVKEDGNDFVFKDFNRAGERIDNDSRERLIGRSIFDVRPSVEQFGLIDVLKEVWKTGSPANHPITHYQDDKLSGLYENYIYKLPSGEVVAVFNDVTEKKQAEETLQTQKELLQEITANYPNSYIYIIENDLTVGFASGQEFKKTNQDPDLFIGLPIEQVFEEEARVVKEYCLRTFQGEETTFELVIDGQDLQFRAVLLKSDIEKIERILVVVENITERKRKERKLKESEEKFRRLSDATFEGIVVTQDKILLSANHQYFQMVGYEPAELLGKQLGKLTLTPESRERLKQVEQIEQIGKGTYQAVTVKRDGTHMPIEIRIRETMDAGRKIRVTAIRDITERLQSERALRESEEKFRTVFEVISEGIAAFELNSQKLVLANRAMCTMLGYQLKEVLQLHVKDIHPEENLQQVLTAIEDQVSGKAPHANDIPFKRKDGQVVMADVTSIPTVLDGQRVLLGCIRDVTEKRNLQASLAQADRLSSMGMLAAGVAHEINNPLSYILYNLSSLNDDFPKLLKSIQKFQARLRKRLGQETFDEITGNTGRMLTPNILNDFYERFSDALSGTRRIRDIARALGTFSRVEETQLVSINIMHVIDVCIDMAFTEIKYRARVTKDYGRTPDLLASEGRLSQVFLNLIINAAHSIDEGDIANNEIRIRTWAEDDHVCVEIRDTGKGIAPNHLKRLFEPFFSTKAIGMGSGLGLSISKNIIEGYGGRIEVKSVVGKGSSFTVQIPIREVMTDLEDMESSISSVEPEIPGRVLIVEDESSVRNAIARMLKGHYVVAVESGAEAQQLLLKDQAFDIILCDMMMPDVSGMDLHEWLTQINPYLAQQFIFITGGAFTPRSHEYLQKVSNIHLEKPFDLTNFKKIIGELIRSARSNSLGHSTPGKSEKLM